jgi:DNA-binding MarR family transcriptional regulator
VEQARKKTRAATASKSRPKLAPVATPPRDLNASLRFGFLIHDVSRLRRVVVDRALKPLGVTRSQWWLLAFLSRRDGMTQTALAADLDLSKVAIGGLVDRVEALGFVERRADKSDGRARRVFTRSGAKMVSVIRENVQQVELEIVGGLSDAEMSAAAATLAKLKNTLLAMAGGEGETESASDIPPIE